MYQTFAMMSAVACDRWEDLVEVDELVAFLFLFFLTWSMINLCVVNILLCIIFISKGLSTINLIIVLKEASHRQQCNGSTLFPELVLIDESDSY